MKFHCVVEFFPQNHIQFLAKEEKQFMAEKQTRRRAQKFTIVLAFDALFIYSQNFV